jgi:methyl-accepting chemotaxis protein/methyl-accepting chemotaxis protein-1 (serine sensor receptor)
MTEDGHRRRPFRRLIRSACSACFFNLTSDGPISKLVPRSGHDMRMRLGLTARLLGAFGTLVACLAIAVCVSYWLSRSMSASQREATDVATRVRLATTLKGYNTEMFAWERAIIVAYTANDAENVTAWHDTINKIFAAAERDTKALAALMPTEAERQQVAALGQGTKAWESGCFACHDADSDMNDPAKMQRLSAKTLALVASNQKLADEIEAGQKRQFEAYAADAERQAAYSVWLLAALCALVVAVSAGVVLMVRGIGKGLSSATFQLKDGVTEVFEAAAQVASSAQVLSENANQQAAALEETGSAMTELASMTAGNARHSADAAKCSADAQDAAEQANVALTSMVSSMESIQNSSQKVAKILRTVDEIAFQTNILALNAAVEAARAGEAGMGFAVVADEVRNLAQRSAQAAKDTAVLIEESLTATQSGRERVSHMESAISSVTESIAKVRQLADLVREASAQQTQGFEQVTRSLTEIERATQATAATAEESAAASETLNAQAEASTAYVHQLAAIVTGTSGDAHARAQRGDATALSFDPTRDERLPRAS